MRHYTGGLNKWSIELTRLSQRSVAVSHSIIHIAELLVSEAVKVKRIWERDDCEIERITAD